MGTRSRIPIAADAAHKAGFWTKKGLGQHLLRDATVVEDALEALRPSPGDSVLEIGPGLGALTESLLKLGLPVIGVEIDPKACAVLRERFGDLENFHLVQRDILKLDLPALLKERKVQRLQVAANLPYYITTPVIAGLLEKEIPFERMVALTQLEVAQRLVAKPGGKAYAAISVLAQFWCRVTLLRKVPPGAFTPPPKVHSGLLLFERQASPRVQVGNRELFFKVARSSFGKRRKTLRNGLKMSGDLRLADRDLEAAFKKSGVDPTRRPETLSLGEFAALTDSIEELLCAE